MTARILIAEFAHETNRFSQRPTDLEAFRGRTYLEGLDLIEGLRGTNTEIGGFIEVAEKEGWDLVPTVAASAGPSGLVTKEAWDTITGKILAGLNEGPEVQGLLLALHGAMVSEVDDDGEGALLELLRARVGPDLPIMVTLDLHTNVTDRMAALASALISYRTYPHIDAAERAVEAALLMKRTLAGSIKPAVSVARGAMLKGADDGRTTGSGPMLDFLAEARRLEAEEVGVLNVSVNAGFADSDIYDAGPSVTVTGNGPSQRWQQLADDLLAQIWERRQEESVAILTVEEAMAQALEAPIGEGAIVIADFADNPGAGAYGDSTTLLKAMLAADFENAAFGGLYDPGAALELHAAGLDATVTVELGGKTDPRFGGGPLTVTGEVVALGDGPFTYEGPMRTGSPGDLGPSAALRVGGMDILVVSRNAQMLDRGLFRVGKIQPEEKSVIGVKSMQHFRGAFAPLARLILVCDSGALCSNDYRSRPFKNVRRPIYPLDDGM